jgi:hypothetical protein
VLENSTHSRISGSPMKLLLTVSFSLFFMARLCGESTPNPGINRLVDQRAAAIRKIDAVFIQELEKLKASLMEQGDLVGANQAQKIIEANISENEIQSDGVGGKWKIYDPTYPSAWSGIIKINEDMSYEWNGANGYSDIAKPKGSCKIISNKLIMGPYSFNLLTLDSGKIFSYYKDTTRVMEKMAE